MTKPLHQRRNNSKLKKTWYPRNLLAMFAKSTEVIHLTEAPGVRCQPI